MRRPFATVAIAALVAGVAFVSSGCGVQTGVAGSGGADLAHGQQLFISTCGGCHTLAEAGTKGVIGPNLDAAYAQPRSNGFSDSSFEALVREQIQRGFPYARPTPMPANCSEPGSACPGCRPLAARPPSGNRVITGTSTCSPPLQVPANLHPRQSSRRCR